MPPSPASARTNILGVGVSAIDMGQAVAQIARWIEEGAREYVVVACVNDIMHAHRDPALRRMTNAAGMVTPDGMPLVFLSRWLGQAQVDRVYGPDLMLTASAMLAERGCRAYYYGGAEGVAERLAEVMEGRFPGLRTAGTYTPPFRPSRRKKTRPSSRASTQRSQTWFGWRWAAPSRRSGWPSTARC